MADAGEVKVDKPLRLALLINDESPVPPSILASFGDYKLASLLIACIFRGLPGPPVIALIFSRFLALMV